MVFLSSIFPCIYLALIILQYFPTINLFFCRVLEIAVTSQTICVTVQHKYISLFFFLKKQILFFYVFSFIVIQIVIDEIFYKKQTFCILNFSMICHTFLSNTRCICTFYHFLTIIIQKHGKLSYKRIITYFVISHFFFFD